MHTVRPGIWQETIKTWEMKCTGQVLEYIEKPEKRKKKKRHKHFLTWNIARNNKNVENEKGTLQELEYGKKTEKREK